MKKPSWLKRIKFIGFDLDGTLYRSVPEVWGAIQQHMYQTVMKDQKWSREETETYVRSRYRELGSSTKVLRELGINAEEFFTRIFNDIDLTKFVKPDTKLQKIMTALSARYRLGIISNNGRLAVNKKLTAIGLSPELFDPIISTYEVGVFKPDRAPYLMALEKARCKPSESVFVGDREENDIAGAKAVGMHSIMVWGESKEADMSLQTIYDLKKIFLEET